MPRLINIAGMDPSMNNWGIATGCLDLATMTVQIQHIDVTQPVLPTGKQVRQNSKDLEAALQLYRRAYAMMQGSQAIFVEIPVGSQSARAMASYGICMGVLAGLRAQGIPFFEVTPTEVKLAATGNKNATKADMIGWATKLHPEANWPTYNRDGQRLISEAKAEHMADAIGAIHAGLKSNLFQQMLPLIRS